MKNKKIIEKAKKKYQELQKKYTDPRFLKTIGKLKSDGYLEAPGVPNYRGMVFLDDALWAANFEPRVLELLPAIITRQPKYFTYLTVPEDLKKVASELKAGSPKMTFRGVEPKKYAQWYAMVGKRNLLPKIMCTFRLSSDDLTQLEFLKNKTKKSGAKIISEALELYKHEKKF